MIGLLAKKIGMTQLFDAEGKQVPITVLEAGPCYVTALRTKDKNGYTAVQLGFGHKREKNSTKPELGQYKKAGTPSLRFVREIRTEEVSGLAVGAKISVENFEVGDVVDVQGTSIGHGFQGVVKRHHFKGAQTFSHGDMSRRRPGSIGASSFPSRVVKGMRAAGHMGNEVVTIQNLKVIKVDAANNLLAVKGSIPGAEGGYLVVRTALKKGTKRSWKVQGSSKESSKETPQEPKSEKEA